MVEREKRSQLADLLEAFISGNLTNDEYVDQESELRAKGRPPRREWDLALEAANEWAWCFWDDRGAYRLVGKDALPAESLAEVKRLILFLRSDLEYEWPVDRFMTSGGGCLLNVLTLGLLGRFRSRRLRKETDFIGDSMAWPFIRESDYRGVLAQGSTPQS